MKVFMKRLVTAFLLLISCIFVFSACKNGAVDDPYKNYKSAGLKVKSIAVDYENDDILSLCDRIELFSDHKSYAAYKFHLNYTESYFELNDLLVFAVKCCSSDEMKFGEIFENEKMLYPLFSRKEIADGQPVTDDVIVLAYCVELPKDTEYKVGKIIFRYK